MRKCLPHFLFHLFTEQDKQKLEGANKKLEAEKKKLAEDTQKMKGDKKKLQESNEEFRNAIKNASAIFEALKK